MFDRRLITTFNWPFMLVALALSIMGIFNLYSATSTFDGVIHTNYFKHQIIWTLIGLGLLLVVIMIHYRHFASMAYIIYGGGILLLVMVLVVGRKVSGHQSWLQLGPISLQPTEIAKIAFIFGLSKFLASENSHVKASFTDLIPSFVFFLIPAILVVLQGDLGSSLFFGLIYGSLILVRGVRWKVLAVLLALFVVVSVVSYQYILSPYQKNRIVTFLHPELERRGAGYHLIQSKIAVGSGGWTGKGYLKGQTHKLKFIPERHTDFIFPVIAEEWGFVGSLVVLFSFLTFLVLGLQVAGRCTDRFTFYLCTGIVALFFWHMVINLGGVLGLMPLTGVPLPFFSYGGSALLTIWIGIALILNISMRRFVFS